MPSMTIRDVPDETRNELAARASRSGRSLQEYIRASLIELASRPDLGSLVAELRETKSSIGSRLPAARILELRDAERR
jgi:plasmid stability protein